VFIAIKTIKQTHRCNMLPSLQNLGVQPGQPGPSNDEEEDANQGAVDIICSLVDQMANTPLYDKFGN